MCGAIVSGAILSRYALSFLPINGGRSFARNLHMLPVYWGGALMGLHLGLHRNMIIGMARKFASKPSTVCKYLLRFIAFLIAGYDVYAFIKRDIISYMILANQFAFFDFEEPLIWFLLDYIACMGTVVCIGYFCSTGLRRIWRRSRGDK